MNWPLLSRTITSVVIMSKVRRMTPPCAGRARCLAGRRRAAGRRSRRLRGCLGVKRHTARHQRRRGARLQRS